jgi:dTDP-4-dehydrorhamnose reductase
VAHAATVLAGRRNVSGPLHVAGPEALSRSQFAVMIARWLGLDPTALRTTTMAEQGIARPGRVVLDSSGAASMGLRCRPPSEWLVSCRSS